MVWEAVSFSKVARLTIKLLFFAVINHNPRYFLFTLGTVILTLLHICQLYPTIQLTQNLGFLGLQVSTRFRKVQSCKFTKIF